jgi:hypothetical protein
MPAPPSAAALAEQRKRRTEKTLQEGALGSAPGEDPKSEQNSQQMAGQVVSGLHGGDRAALLSSGDAAAEERFDLCQTLRHHLAEIRIVRRDFERRVHDHAALPVRIAQGLLHNLVEERADRLLGRHPCIGII